jgi:hypothetical protein
MPAELLEDPAGISCVFSDGRRYRRTIAAEPAVLVRDLFEGLAGLVHPHGSVDSPGAVTGYVQGIVDIARFMRDRGAGGGAAQLSRGLLAEYWMQANGIRESVTRRMLASFDAVSGGALREGARELAAGRHFKGMPSSSPLVPYTGEEWARLHQACRDDLDEAFARHRQALKLAAGGHDPRDGGWAPANKRWLLMQAGPLSDVTAGEYVGRSATWVARTAGGIRAASDELFPGVSVVVAYRLLLGVYTGIVPDGIAGLGIGDVDWAGDAAVLLSYVKGRTAAESLTLPRRAVRLLEQWLEHSAPLRNHAPEGLRDSLWLFYSHSGNGEHWHSLPDSSAQQRWGREHGLSVDRRRIRTTYLSLRDRSRWHGSSRSAIDPNHTPAVEGDHYLTAATPAQRDALDTIIEDAQHDLLGKAHPPVVLAGEDAAELAAAYPGLVAGLNLDDATIAGLLGGEQDVFVAACADPLSGLHGPPGKPCPARPWVCLLCPLAVFTPRHAANLLRLKAFFARQWAQMPSAQFMAVFGPYSTRITQILERYPAPVIAAAAAAAGDATDHQIPLRPEERTT